MQSPYYQIPNFQLFLGNSIELIKELPENSVDMIFADPPYMLSNDGFTVQSGKKASVNKGNWDKSQGLKKDFEFHLGWIQAAKRILKPEGTIWITGTHHSIYQCGFALQVTKFHILNEIAWYKPSHQPNFSKRALTASHESVIWAKKEKSSKHIFNYEVLKNLNPETDILKKPNNQMHSVWVINTPSKEEIKYGRHPAQKPLELLDRVIMASTEPGDLIFDPFCGSGTTGVSANIHGRSFIGIDMEREYLDLTIKRIQAIPNSQDN